MAYQDTHHVALGDSLRHRLAALGRLASRVGNGLISVAEGNRRIRMVERLQARSDAELDAMGLRREDIVRYVFRDVFFD